MTDQPTDPAAVEVWARMLCAADVHVYGGEQPTWQQLGMMSRKLQDDYRKAARWLLPRLTVGQSAATPPAPVGDFRRDRYAAAMAKRDGHEWPTEFEDDERDYRRRADAAIAVADAELSAAQPVRTRIAIDLNSRDRSGRVLAYLEDASGPVAAGDTVTAVEAGEGIAVPARVVQVGADGDVYLEADWDAAVEDTAGGRGLREIIAGTIYGCRYPDDDWGKQRGGIRSVYLGHADAVLAVLPEPRREFDVEAGLQLLADALHRGEPADGAANGIDWKAKYETEHARHVAVVRALVGDPLAVLRGAADEIDRETQRQKDHGVLEPDKFRPCRDATADLRRMADEAQQAGEGEPKRTPMDPVHILGVGSEDPDEAAALRSRLLARPAPAVRADTAQQPEVFGPEVVAYRHPTKPRAFLCRQHGEGRPGLTPVEADDLEYGGLCGECGGDVLARQAGEGR